MLIVFCCVVVFGVIGVVICSLCCLSVVGAIYLRHSLNLAVNFLKRMGQLLSFALVRCLVLTGQMSSWLKKIAQQAAKNGFCELFDIN